MNEDVLNKVLEAKENRKEVILATQLENGNQLFLNDKKEDGLSSNLKQIASDLIKNKKSGVINIGNNRWFIDISLPSLRLLVVGAVHIAQPLANIASVCEFDITIIDPRSTFATEKRFPNIKVLKDWPSEALNNLVIDDRTAIVTLTHDPKLDDSALEIALKSRAFYIGSLGSSKTHESRKKRLEKSGFTEKQIKKINGPVGMDIRAKSPNEIAVAIMSEIIFTYRS